MTLVVSRRQNVVATAQRVNGVMKAALRASIQTGSESELPGLVAWFSELLDSRSTDNLSRQWINLNSRIRAYEDLLQNLRPHLDRQLTTLVEKAIGVVSCPG